MSSSCFLTAFWSLSTQMNGSRKAKKASRGILGVGRPGSVEHAVRARRPRALTDVLSANVPFRVPSQLQRPGRWCFYEEGGKQTAEEQEDCWDGSRRNVSLVCLENTLWSKTERFCPSGVFGLSARDRV